MRVRRVLAVALVVVLVAIGLGLASIAWFTGRALPQTSGALQIRGLHQPVTVIRDVAGVAHIRAANVHDLFMAQGFVHAQERMWQMEVWRHIAAGRLSELFGESQLDTDRFIRTLGWPQSTERDLAAVTPETRRILDAYAEGVNAWLDKEHDSLGLAFVVTGAKPEPWKPLDTLGWQKVQAWNLGSNMDQELFRYLADRQLGDPDRTDELFPQYRDGAPVITPSGGDEAAADAEAAVFRTATSLDGDAAAAWREMAEIGASISRLAGLDAGEGLVGSRGVGSNNWVISPAMTTTGGAMLANDPHLGISMPSIWFMNGLHCTTVSEACPYDVAGVSFPGVPAVVLGHNARIAWGATNLGPDVQDLFVERADPNDPAAYLLDGVSTPFDERVEEIRTAGGPTSYQTVRTTVHGPILNDVDGRLEDAPLMSLAWTAIRGTDRTFEAILGLNTASDFDEFRASLSQYGSPSQNFVYADVDGHIGYQFPGSIPIRGGDPTGDRPRPGDDGSSEWTGLIPFEELPWQLDPAEGTIVTANNAAVDAGYPYHVASDWDPGYRAERIGDQLLARGEDGLSFDDMTELQLDTALPRAQDAVTWLLPMAPSTDDGRVVLERILDWDGRCEVDSLGCAAWSMFEYHLHRDLFDDELGTLARDYVGSGPAWVLVNQLVDEPEASWWDDVATAERETSMAIINRALDEAGSALSTSYGPPSGWTWGRLHTATFQEQTVGKSGIGPLEWYFNDGPHAVPGAAGAVNNTYYRFRRAYPDPLDPDYVPVGVDRVFEVTNMPSMRFVIDMTDLDGARIVITTGQSGNPFDHHYNDLIEPWRTGETVPLPFTPAALDAAAAQTLVLQP
ncbi:MAG TPA: penicillin acylase family protein [Candidatus Limnocylindrales bacterium]|nr:penicillin acylase family protein [Candidatus Limnocylindrales bacterium]